MSPPVSPALGATPAGLSSAAVRGTVLLVDGGPEAKLRSVRPITDAGLECVESKDLEGAAAALARSRVNLVLVEARALERSSPSALLGLRAGMGGTDLPIVLLASKETPSELLEKAARAGMADCILGPLRVGHVQSRMAALGSVISSERMTSAGRHRQYLLLLGPPTDYRAKLGAFLELSGFRLLYADSISDLRGKWSPDCHPVDGMVLTGGVASSIDEAAMVLLGRVGGHNCVRLVIASNLSEATREVDVLSTRAMAVAATFVESCSLAVIAQGVYSHLRRHDLRLRADERVPFHCIVEVKEDEANAKWSSGLSFDLSPGGIFVRSLVCPRPGVAVSFRIHLSLTREVLEGTGVVAWAHPFSGRDVWSHPVGMGIQFLGMSPGKLGRLRALCEEQAASQG